MTGTFTSRWERGDGRPLVIISLLYLIAYGMILLNNGLFWDDWLLVTQSDPELAEYFKSLGHPEVYYLHHFLLSLPGSTYLYKVLVFLSFWGSALLLYRVLAQVKEIDEYSRFFLVALFALFPVNNARIALINTPAALKSFLFFLGGYLLVAALRSGKFLPRAAALCCFLFSFTLNSVLFFYLVVVSLLILYFGTERHRTLRGLALNHADLLLLPFLFWVGKTLFFAPYGAGASYNVLKSSGLAGAATVLVVPFYTSLVEVLMMAFNNYNGISLLSTLLLAALVTREPERGIDPAFGKRAGLAGVALFCAGVFPYLSVNKMPSNFDWDGRFQVLIPLGASVIIYYTLSLIMKKVELERSMRHLVLCFVLISFVGMSLAGYVQYKRDWYKQLSVMENMKPLRDAVANREVAFVDRTPDLNANSRSYRRYEYQGLLNTALGRGVAAVRKPNAGDPSGATLFIDHGDYPLNSRNIFCLMVRELFTPDLFLVNVRRATTLTVL